MAVDIKKFTTMKVGGSVANLKRINNPRDVATLVEEAMKSGLDFFVLGEGSNTVFTDGLHELLVGKMEIAGTDLENGLVTVGAGESWDKLVKWSIAKGLSGLEALSGIPGTVGAAPVQNIGAYGSEIFQVIKFVEAYDLHKKEFVTLQNKDMQFKYRDSIFKQNLGRFVVLRVVLELGQNKFPPIPNYKDVIVYFESVGIKKPSTKEIRRAILEIRHRKLPSPAKIPNSGSFFKNPILPNSIAEKLKLKYEDMFLFPIDSTTSKISAGWLLEKAGFKGYSMGNVGTYKNNTLVLVNKGSASFADLNKLRNLIKQKIQNQFGIILEEEVNII